jgi:sugar phosphate isomerase/epimerase
MQLGIHVNTFSGVPLEELLDHIVLLGLECLHFNFAVLGMEPMPESVDPQQAAQIGHQVALRGLSIASLSGTFNMIHPDRELRQRGLHRLDVLAEAAARMQAPVISLCTGTRDPHDKWRRHPENSQPAAWQDLVDVLARALRIAERHDVILGIEPEPANVVDSAPKARNLLEEIASPRLKIIFDMANIVAEAGPANEHQLGEAALDLLGPEIVLAHAKNLDLPGGAPPTATAPEPLDLDRFLSGLRRIGFDGPLIMHGIERNQAVEAVELVREKLAALD